MKFGIFYEHQMGRPWDNGGEYQLIQDALVQVELADRLGIQYVWEVEHHFLEEYSHSSAPEVFLAACSQRTKNIRLGHGVILTSPKFNHLPEFQERDASQVAAKAARLAPAVEAAMARRAEVYQPKELEEQLDKFAADRAVGKRDTTAGIAG